jgi:hypothetical protein
VLNPVETAFERIEFDSALCMRCLLAPWQLSGMGVRGRSGRVCVCYHLFPKNVSLFSAYCDLLGMGTVVFWEGTEIVIL